MSFESADTSVTAAICLYGYYGHYFGALPDETPHPNEPQGYIHPGAPPILVAHGTKGARATAEGARDFAARLRHVSGSTVEDAELPGAQHAFDVYHPPRFEAVVDGVEAFAARVLAAQKRASDSARQDLADRSEREALSGLVDLLCGVSGWPGRRGCRDDEAVAGGVVGGARGRTRTAAEDAGSDRERADAAGTCSSLREAPLPIAVWLRQFRRVSAGVPCQSARRGQRACGA